MFIFIQSYNHWYPYYLYDNTNLSLEFDVHGTVGKAGDTPPRIWVAAQTHPLFARRPLRVCEHILMISHRCAYSISNFYETMCSVNSQSIDSIYCTRSSAQLFSTAFTNSL